MRRAFSLIELTFVIVVLGIVASIGSDIIAQVYQSYVVQRAQYRATIKSELALTQIANRLRYAIGGTIVSRKTLTDDPVLITEMDPTMSDYKVIQWVSYDGEGFNAGTSTSDRRPGWSGFCDISAYSKGSTTLPTPGSNPKLSEDIIKNLGGDLKNAKIYFADSNVSLGVDGYSGEAFKLDEAIPVGSLISERYKLAWRSLALVVDSNKDLWLYYNFAPDYGADITGPKSLLLHNVTTFRFLGTDGSIRIKLCKQERISDISQEYITACKEKVIF